MHKLDNFKFWGWPTDLMFIIIMILMIT